MINDGHYWKALALIEEITNIDKEIWSIGGSNRRKALVIQILEIGYDDGWDEAENKGILKSFQRTKEAACVGMFGRHDFTETVDLRNVTSKMLTCNRCGLKKEVSSDD